MDKTKGAKFTVNKTLQKCYLIIVKDFYCHIQYEQNYIHIFVRCDRTIYILSY